MMEDDKVFSLTLLDRVPLRRGPGRQAGAVAAVPVLRWRSAILPGLLCLGYAFAPHQALAQDNVVMVAQSDPEQTVALAASVDAVDAIYYASQKPAELREPYALASAGDPDKREFVFTYADSPPLGFTNVQGKPDGYFFKLAKATLDSVGVNHKQLLYPVGRMYASVADGSSDMTISVPGPAFDLCCMVGKLPVAFDELSAYHLEGKPAIKSPEDLVGKRVIKLLGYSYGGALDFLKTGRGNTQIEQAPNRESALQMLINGRADYLLDYAAPLQGLLSRSNITGLKRDTIKRLDFFVILSKKVPEPEKMLRRLESTISTLQKTPEFKPPAL